MVSCTQDRSLVKSVNDYVSDLREDLLHSDALLGCLLALSSFHGSPCTGAMLTAGLPLEDGRLSPLLFSRAALRAGLSSRIQRQSLSDIDDLALPAVLLLKKNLAVVLLGWNGVRDSAVLLLPETGHGSIEMALGELEERYTGVTIFARPQFLFDKRAPEVGSVVQRHWFWGTIFEQRGVYSDVVFAAFTINLFALIMPLFTMNIYDRVVPNNAIETLWVLTLGVFLVLGMDFAVRLMRGYFIDLAGARIDLKVSATLMERVLGMRLEGRPASVGAFAANLRSFESMRDFIASSSMTALIDFPFALVFLIALAWIAWPLVFIPLIGLVVGVVYAYLIQIRMHELSETSYRALAMRNATLVESLAALETIKAQSAEGTIQKKWENTTAFLARVGAQTRLLSASAINGASVIAQVVNVLLITAGVYLIQEKQLSMGGLIAVTMLGARAMSPLGQLVGLLLQFQGARLSLETLDKLMKQAPERPAGRVFIHRPKLLGEIEFCDLTFNYPEQNEAVLQRISLHIFPGEHVVILGSIGSGKSTLQKLMMGLYQPIKGSVRVDGIDQRQLDPADLRRNIGYVGQEAMLFFGTLRENITIGAPCADDSMVIAAAEIAGLTSYINRHPNGYDMLIGERGESLSGGQRQAVAIARAVLMNPPILILDEPTNAMDFSAEAAFKDRLKKYAAKKTVVIVTHRTSLVDLATRIVVLDEGRIVADGPREQIIEALRDGRVRRTCG